MDSVQIVELIFDLEDAEVISCTESDMEDILYLNIKAKDGRIFKFQFNEAVSFTQWQGGLSKLLLNSSESESLNVILKKIYDYPFHYIPTNHPYKLFQFVDSMNEATLEIICVSFNYQLCEI
jgi:hypothetical protein